MKFLTLFFVFIGFLLLALSLKPTRKILVKTQERGWKVLFLLILSFLLMYAGSFIYVISLEEFENTIFAYGVLLVSGGAFVFLVTSYSLNSIFLQEFQTTHDRTTNLKNRFSFTRSIQRLVDKSEPFYIMLIDLNSFKQFNDAFGHSFGDELLKQVANRISKSFSTEYRLFRVGGDEFAVVRKDSDSDNLDRDIKTIQQLFSQALTVQNQNLSIGITIGISIYPCAIKSSDDLIQQAEQALYAAKTSKGNWKIFSEDLNKDILEHLDIVSKLQRAIANNEFSLFYQPIIHSSNKFIHGAEVLIRWKQPDGSYISPDKFIPIAEQSTLIHDITCWVIKKAIKDITMLDTYGFNGHLHINLSAKDLHNNKLVSCLENFSKQSKLEPNRLTFEITESAMMTDVKQAALIMTQLAKAGFSFSLDDFGTGYSSFSLLRDLPLSQLKVDRSFVAGMKENDSNHSIVRSMIYLAKSLNCSVVAEGVEDEETTLILEQMDCDYMQGYFFSKPLPLEQYLKLATLKPLDTGIAI